MLPTQPTRPLLVYGGGWGSIGTPYSATESVNIKHQSGHRTGSDSDDTDAGETVVGKSTVGTKEDPDAIAVTNKSMEGMDEHDEIDTDCPICFEPTQHKLGCGHLLCTECIVRWKAAGQEHGGQRPFARARCPLCRAQVGNITTDFHLKWIQF